MCKMCCVERVWFRKPVSYSSVWVRDGKEPGLRGSKELWEWMEQKKKSERFKPGNLRNTSLQGKGKGENTGAGDWGVWKNIQERVLCWISGGARGSPPLTPLRNQIC